MEISDYIGIIIPIAIAGVGFWLRVTLKDAAEKNSQEVSTTVSGVKNEVRKLSEKITSELTLSARDRDVGDVMRQVSQQHVSENSVEHERMIAELKEISAGNAKQSETLKEISTILKGLAR